MEPIVKIESTTAQPNKNRQCSVCSRSFAKKSHLIAHFRSHTGERPFTCTFEGCGNTFIRNDHLTRHIKSHVGDRAFKCDFPNCKSAFITSDHLRRHQNTHIVVLKYKCEFCGALFALKSEIRPHCLKIHGTTELVCKYEGCGKSFATLCTLQKHMENHEKSFYASSFRPDCPYNKRMRTMEPHEAAGYHYSPQEMMMGHSLYDPNANICFPSGGGWMRYHLPYDSTQQASSPESTPPYSMPSHSVSSDSSVNSA